MKQVITITLKKEPSIEQIRKRYLPEYKKFKPHITIVYPFQVKDQKELQKHIKEAVKELKPFTLKLKGLKKSAKEYYLYLLVDTGKSKIIKLYNKLNQGILKDFKNKDMPTYIPHLSLGIFKSKKDIDAAVKELKKENITFKTKIESIQLLTIDKKHNVIISKNYKF